MSKLTNAFRRRTLKTLGLLAVAGGLSTTAWAQTGPARILVGFPAGGSIDALARIIGEKLEAELGRPVIVDNRPGAGGRLAVDVLKGQPKDGSVVLLSPEALQSLYPFTYTQLNYNPSSDMVPVAQVSNFAMALAVPATSGVKTIEDLVTWMRENPRQANYGIPALGTPMHFFGLTLSEKIQAPMENIPFQGSAPMMVNLIGNQIPAAIDVVGSVVEHHKAGAIKVLAVSSPERAPQLPDVPTFRELGYPEITGTGINGFYMAAGNPAEARERWESATIKVLQDPQVAERIRTLGFNPDPKSAAGFQEGITASTELWRPIIEASGFKAD